MAECGSWVLHVPRMPPSQNDFKSGGMPKKGASVRQLWAFIRGRAFAYEKLVQDWRRDLEVVCREAGVWRAEGPRSIWFTRLMSPRNRMLDVFNLAGGLKPVVDAMVHLDLLVDDDPAHFRPILPDQRRCQPGEVPGLRIVITELEPDQGELFQEDHDGQETTQ